MLLYPHREIERERRRAVVAAMGRKKKGTEQYRWHMLGGWGTFSNEGRKRELEPCPKTAQLALNRVPELEFKVGGSQSFKITKYFRIPFGYWVCALCLEFQTA